MKSLTLSLAVALLATTATAAQAGPDAGRMDPAQCERCCAELRALLASDDAAALELLERENALLQQAFGARFIAIQQAAADFDFGQALTLLDEAVAGLTSHG